MGWRLIDTDVANPYFVTAADEVIYKARKEKRIKNTLHFYRREECMGLRSSLETFKNICYSVTNALENLNIHTVYKPPNDILLNGKKISGSATIQKDNIILIHGTILINTNLELMKKVLKRSKNNKVSTIYKEIGYLPSIENIKEELKKNFEKYYDINFEKSTLSNYENNLIDKLLKERYLNNSWNFIR